MVQVGLVGTEWRRALQHTRRHHAQRIEHGNRQHRQRERYKPDIGVDKGCDPRTGLQDGNYEDGHDGAHDQRPAVADEHLRGFTKNIVQEEGNQGPDRNYRQDRHHLFAGEMEKYAEDGAGHDTIARRKTVYAVHQVDGVDNANGGKNSQRHGIPGRDRPDAPQTAEVVYAIAADKDQQQHDDDLDQKPQGRGKVQNIVHRAGIEHRHHGHDYDRQSGAVHDSTHAPDSDHDPEENGDAAQDRNRRTLQFTGIRIIDNVFQQRDFHQFRVDPAD